MRMFLDIAAAWILLDVALIATWHLAHVRIRRLRARVTALGSTTQPVYTLAPDALPRDPVPALVPAGHG